MMSSSRTHATLTSLLLWGCAIALLAACSASPVPVRSLSATPAVTSQPTETSTPADPVEPVTEARVLQARLPIPPYCASVIGVPASTQVQLEDGSAFIEASTRTLRVMAVSPATLSGQQVALVALRCNPAAEYSEDVLAIYDASLAVVAEFAPGPDGGWHAPAHTSVTVIDAVSMEADGTIALHVGDAGLPSDVNLFDGSGSASMTLYLAWDGQSLQPSRVVFHTPNGDRTLPSLEEVQALYDAISRGDDAAAGAHMSAADLSLYHESACEGPCSPEEAAAIPTYAGVFFPAGGTVDYCELIGPAGDTYTTTRGHVLDYFPRDEVADGDIICPITTTRTFDDARLLVSNPDTEWGYSEWFVITASSSPTDFTARVVRNAG